MKHKEQLTELRRLTEKQIFGKIKDNQTKLVTLQQDKMLGKLKNTGEINQLKKSVARLFTVLDEKISAATKENQ